MSNIVTGGLAGLVAVLAVALWSKSGSPSESPLSSANGSTSGTGKSSKSKKNKKKTNKGAGAAAAAAAAAPTTGQGAKGETAASANSHANNKKNGTSERAVLAEASDKTAFQPGDQKHRSEKAEAGKAASREKEVSAPAVQVAGKAASGALLTQAIDASAVGHYDVPELTGHNDDDDGWESVGGKARLAPTAATPSKSKNNPGGNAWAASNPFAVLPESAADAGSGSGARVISLGTTSSASGLSAANGSGGARPPASASSAPTKRQRQNAARAQAKKAERDAQEVERQDRLAQHKRQLESERMRAADKRPARPTPRSVPGRGAAAATDTTMGPRASVNEKGSLVWD